VGLKAKESNSMTLEEQLNAWKHVHADIAADRHLTFLNEYSGTPGALVLSVYHASVPQPIGQLFFHSHDRLTVGILNIVVFEHCRRRGLATRMLDWLFENWCPEFTRAYTMNGTELGAGWLRGYGFTENRFGWYYKRPKGRGVPGPAPGDNPAFSEWGPEKANENARALTVMDGVNGLI
jgi:ribosomal protein S18 acetylase RimI-like enzyme